MLTEKSKSVAGVQQWPYKAVAKALEVIPRTLIQNCGANTIRTLTALRVSTRDVTSPDSKITTLQVVKRGLCKRKQDLISNNSTYFTSVLLV